ncbi:hypothetical protein U6B65_07755 [Oscillospiraceae bacterium MB08-C2-2]|nr:hypothetical protein U6B65_07755 [Oscillospiraceae bacterium MB08-C2-2]
MINNRFSQLEQQHYKHKMEKMTGRTGVASSNKASLWSTEDSTDSSWADTAQFQSTGKLNLISLGPKATQEVKDVWNMAVKTTGVDKLESSAYLSSLFAIQAQQKSSTGSADVLGSTKESAVAAVKKALTYLDKLSGEKVNTKVQEYRQLERNFYNAFLAGMAE